MRNFYAGQTVWHAEQVMYILGMESNDADGAKGALFATYEASHDNFSLKPINAEDWPVAQAKLDAVGGTVALRKLCQGDFFWHPECAKCNRCRKHTPECGFDAQRGRQVLLCNRCAEAIKHNESKKDT